MLSGALAFAFLIVTPAMFSDKLPQSFRIGIRPDETAAKAGVALVINRCAMCQSESQEANLDRAEH